MSNVLAAIGVEQFKKLENMNNKRQVNAKYLLEALADVPITLPYVPEFRTHVYQMFIVQAHEKRDELLEHLKGNGIGATVFSDPPVHKHPYYTKHVPSSELEVTDKVAQHNIVLPMYPQLTEKEMDYIAGTIKTFFN